jgi:hypothetical protein
MWFVALIPELFGALAEFIAAGGWWQVPAIIALFKVEETVTNPLPQTPPAQQSPLQQGAAAATQVPRAVGSFAEWFAGEGKFWAIGLGAAFVLLGRR